MRVRRCSIRWKLASRPSVLWSELEGPGLDVSFVLVNRNSRHRETINVVRFE